MENEKINILVADRSPEFRNLLQKTLEKYFPHVYQAQTGPETLSLCDRRDYSLVIVTNHLPGILGVEVVRRLQQNFPKMKRILISDEDTDPVIESALEWGLIDRFLQKPIELNDLVWEAGYLLGLYPEPPHPEEDESEAQDLISIHTPGESASGIHNDPATPLFGLVTRPWGG